jgi:hypothetical protein
MKAIKQLSIQFLAIITLLFCANITLSANNKNPNDQNWDKREHVYKTSDSFSSFEVRYKGKILVNNDDTDVTSISPNGYLKIEKSSFGNSRAIIIESNNNGELRKEYYEGKTKLDYNPDGKEWLSDIMLEVIRNTGIGGKERVIRIYKQKGLSGVFDEMEDVEDHDIIKISGIIVNFSYSGTNINNLYFKTIIDEIKLSEEELLDYLRELPEVSSNSTKGTILRTIIDKYELNGYNMKKFLKATASLSYNTERGNTLRKFQNKYKITQDNAEEYFDIIRDMSINSEKGNVLKPLLRNQELDNETMIDLIKTVKTFSSTPEKGAVLRIVAQKMNNNSQVVEEYKEAVWALDGAYRYMKEELTFMLPGGANVKSSYDKESVVSMLDMAEQYSTNNKKSTTLRKLHSSLTDDDIVIEKYFDVVNSMTNEMVKYNLLLDLINSGKKLNNSYLYSILNAAEDLADDDYKHGATAILRDIVPILPNDKEVVKQFFDALEEIDHNSGKEEVVRMLCERGNVDNYVIVKMLENVEEIEVDIEIATSLQQIRKVMPKNDTEIDFVFKAVAREIESDYEYERVFN